MFFAATPCVHSLPHPPLLALHGREPKGGGGQGESDRCAAMAEGEAWHPDKELQCEQSSRKVWLVKVRGQRERGRDAPITGRQGGSNSSTGGGCWSGGWVWV